MIAEKMRELGMNVIYPVLRIQYQPAEKHTKAGSGSKLEDARMQEIKMGEGGH